MSNIASEGLAQICYCTSLVQAQAYADKYLKLANEAESNEHDALVAQNKRFKEALELIAGWPGNLPDASYLSETGPKDAVHRGSMVVAMRSFANLALNPTKKHGV